MYMMYLYPTSQLEKLLLDLLHVLVEGLLESLHDLGLVVDLDHGGRVLQERIFVLGLCGDSLSDLGDLVLCLVALGSNVFTGSTEEAGETTEHQETCVLE